MAAQRHTHPRRGSPVRVHLPARRRLHATARAGREPMDGRSGLAGRRGAGRLRHARGRKAPTGDRGDGCGRRGGAERCVHAAGVGVGRRARRRLRAAAEVPLRAAARAAARHAARPAGRSARWIPAPHLRSDGLARAARPARRGLLPLRDRPGLGGAPFREDALRQRAARGALLRGGRRARRAGLRDGRDGYRRVHAAGACVAGGRVRLESVRGRCGRRRGRILPVRRRRHRHRARRRGTRGRGGRVGSRRKLPDRARRSSGAVGGVG